MRTITYRREEAVAYAKKWAYQRNPKYYDFSRIGGDCTNFASQCLYAGAGVMNYTPTLGWFYKSVNDRSASWTGVEFFRNFLIGNAEGIGGGLGPFAAEADMDELEIGDFVQFGRATGDFYHTPIVVGFSRGIPLVAAHTNDTFAKPLNAYRFERLRCLHILGVRV